MIIETKKKKKKKSKMIRKKRMKNELYINDIKDINQK